jgi:hypothetical protein
MHVSCIQAGTLLARLGRPEVSNCIAALEQYGAAYEEIGEHAVEIKRIYASASSGDFDFNHMASVAPKSNGTVVDIDHAMNIDSTSADDNDGVSVHLSFLDGVNKTQQSRHSPSHDSFSLSIYGR